MSNRLYPCSISSKESENILYFNLSFTHRNHHDQPHHRIYREPQHHQEYDRAVTLSDDQIHELVRIATTAPTSFHMQNWRFIAVRTPEAKARLRPIAWDQPMVTDAAVTFIICGQLADPSVIPNPWHRW